MATVIIEDGRERLRTTRCGPAPRRGRGTFVTLVLVMLVSLLSGCASDDDSPSSTAAPTTSAPLSAAEDAYLREVTAAMRILIETLNTYNDLLLSEPWSDGERRELEETLATFVDMQEEWRAREAPSRRMQELDSHWKDVLDELSAGTAMAVEGREQSDESLVAQGVAAMERMKESLAAAVQEAKRFKD